MILILGGTTEGRIAAETLESAAQPYYYSTHDEGQQVAMVHGTRLTGAMDSEALTECCTRHGIRLMVDAAHPFATMLHTNVVNAARQLHLPIVRYERRYSARDDSAIWCRDYDEAMQKMEHDGVGRLLALTGVNTLAPLRPFWRRHECWWRILRRPTSMAQTQGVGFPTDHLIYYDDHTDTATQILQLHPDAIITKESGESGGFMEKVEAAQRMGVRCYVVQRPSYPVDDKDEVTFVDGPYGLRRAVERLVPDFYHLHSGLTSGTCATAAAVAAARRLLTSECSDEVPVVLPNGETIMVAVTYSDDYAAVVKDSGDDPDVTGGLEIRAAVSRATKFEIVGGKGVGVITLPGFDYPPGEAAINRVPRQMIEANLAPFSTPLRVVVSVEGGEEVARRTFNPRLGITGGISIIGVSGIVMPFSEEGFLQSIRKCMNVAVASGAERVVINSGAKSERFVKICYPDLPAQAFVEYGNYIGRTIEMAEEAGVQQLTLGVMMGKAVKLAAGELDTHSRRTTMNRQFVEQMVREAGCDTDISGITLARELWTLLPAEDIPRFAHVVISHCMEHCAPLLPHGTLTILLIDEDGGIYKLIDNP